jgi:isoleucyl-tRNA synthetase
MESEGIEAWHTTPLDELLPAGAKCSHCGGTDFRKETDILDVWFDSGTSWFAVCESDAELNPAYTSFQKNEGTQVLYLEGGDQHRGWFHSSLADLCGAARTRALLARLTAGWTLDEQGRAMSKSLGNGVDPVDIANRWAARLCASGWLRSTSAKTWRPAKT